MSITLMMSAAVSSSFFVLRIRPGRPSALPLTSGMTATPVSKPDSPRASLGKSSAAITNAPM